MRLVTICGAGLYHAPPDRWRTHELHVIQKHIPTRSSVVAVAFNQVEEKGILPDVGRRGVGWGGGKLSTDHRHELGALNGGKHIRTVLTLLCM